MTKPRPDVVVEMIDLAARYGCTAAELRAAIDVFDPQTRRGRPASKIYAPLLWGMYALVAAYGRDRYTAAKQVLSLADGPDDQRESQARALVRRFDEALEGDLLEAQETYAGFAPYMRVLWFYRWWENSGLPLPRDINFTSDEVIKLQKFVRTSDGRFSIDPASEAYIVDLDKSIAASTFDKN